MTVSIHETGLAMHALNAPQGALRTLVQNAATTTGVTAARAGDIATTLRLLGTIQPRTRATLAALHGTLGRANRVLAQLHAPAGDIAPAVAALRPVVRDADALLRTKAQPLLRSLRPTAVGLARTARAGVPVVDELAPSLKRIDTEVLPQLAKVSPESRHATYEMIGPAIAGLFGSAAHYDSTGWFVRLLGSGGGHVYDGLPCAANFASPTSAAYLECQAAGEALGRVFPPLGAGRDGNRRSNR